MGDIRTVSVEQLPEVVVAGLRRAFSLGQTYWRQADSESYRENKLSDETQAKFNDLVSELQSLIASSAPSPGVQEVTDEDRAILEAVHREMDEADGGNAPGHAHEVPGIWDSDNGERAGKPCAWCLTWAKFTRLVQQSQEQKT